MSLFTRIAAFFRPPPELMFGALTTVALPNDPRPAYANWLHVPVTNVGKNAVRVYGAEVELRRLSLDRYSRARHDATIFVRGFYSQITATVLQPGETAYLPLYLTVTSPAPHPLYPDIELAWGSYLTGGTFLFHPELTLTQILDPGPNAVRARVIANGQVFDERFPDVDIPKQAITVELVD